jgi:hypothetical protein
MDPEQNALTERLMEAADKEGLCTHAGYIRLGHKIGRSEARAECRRAGIEEAADLLRELARQSASADVCEAQSKLRERVAELEDEHRTQPGAANQRLGDPEE